MISIYISICGSIGFSTWLSNISISISISLYSCFNIPFSREQYASRDCQWDGAPEKAHQITNLESGQMIIMLRDDHIEQIRRCLQILNSISLMKSQRRIDEVLYQDLTILATEHIKTVVAQYQPLIQRWIEEEKSKVQGLKLMKGETK